MTSHAFVLGTGVHAIVAGYLDLTQGILMSRFLFFVDRTL